MKTSLLASAFVLLVSINGISQKNLDQFKPESEGHFITPVETPFGIVATDNLCSSIYLIHNNSYETLFSAPGCGRYFSLSDDKTKIGFKKINSNGMQVPAVLDLNTKQVTELTSPVKLAGQVVFTANGSISYTIGNELHLVNQGNTTTVDLGTYVNSPALSPQADFVVYNSDDQLYCLNLQTNERIQITDNNGGYMLPNWSPDGKMVLYSSLSGTLKVWDKTKQSTKTIGKGLHAVWSDDSQTILFDRVENENFKVEGSDLYSANITTGVITNLTNTPNELEMYPSFGSNNTILFTTYDKQRITSAKLNDLTNRTVKIDLNGSTLINTHTGALQPNNPNKVSVTMVQRPVPYINQLYDTPDWHGGSGSCAPTSAAMVLAYYNRLPYWDITASWPSPHTSHYGNYIADKYRFNEVYYSQVAGDANNNDAFGGYGYMWGNGNSPHSVMFDYLDKHGINSVRSYSTVFTDVMGQIDSNFVMPICNLLTSAGHLTVAIGYVQGQHTLVFNDPYGNKNNGSWPNYTGAGSYYDWPGYNNGYQNLNQMAWSVSGKSTETIYNDTIIDDIYYNHGFYIYNQGTSLMRYFHDKMTGGYNDHFWYTYTTASTTIDTCYVTWTPNLNTTGDYEVSTFIPSTNANATTARYVVYSDNGVDTVTIDQSANTGWISLGTFPFSQGSGSVRLGDATGVQGELIAFDAVKWAYVPANPLAGIDQSKLNSIRIYPNPVSDILTINGTMPYQIRIIDLQGKTVFSEMKTKSINISHLAAGMYQIQLFNVSNELIYSDKLVKK